MASGTVLQALPVSVEVQPGDKLVVTSPNSGSFGKLWVYDLSGRDTPGLVTMSANTTRVLGPFPTGRRVSIEPDSGSLTYNVRMFADLAIYGAPGAATVGSSYGFAPTAQGGVGTLQYTLTGTLPNGLNFATKTGAITGVPTTIGTTSGLNITVTDGFQSASLGTFLISVGAAIVGVVLFPTNIALPIIVGIAQVGQTLTANTGAWTGPPTAYAYQWLRNGSAIVGATSATYVPVSADIGATLTCAVTATNATGSATATSVATGVVSGASSSGAALPGQGTWSDSSTWSDAQTWHDA